MPTLNIKNFPGRLYRKLQVLAKRERRSLTQEVIHILTRAVGEPERTSILELRGLGKELWKGVDPATHVRRERESWD